MKMSKGAALVAALLGAAGAGAAVAPRAHGQSTSARPPAVEVFSAGRGAQIGVSVRDVEAADAKAGQAGGVVIEEVVEDSPASSAGLRKGDVVVEFDGERVRSVRQFTRLVGETPPGRKVQVGVLRDGQRTSLSVEPRENDGFRFMRDAEIEAVERLRGMRVAPPARAPRALPPSFPDVESFIWRGGSTLGITMSELSPQLADYFGAKEGVLVTSVREDSAASRAGLKAGDVVTAVNGRSVDSPSEMRRELQRLDSGQEFTLSVMRDKKSLTVKGKSEDTRPGRRTFRSTV